MFTRRWLYYAVGFVALATVLGCSRKDLATVSGTVTHNGAPVEGALVTLVSTIEVDGKPMGSYAAKTDSSGKYMIAFDGKNSGIPPGLYKVTVTKLKGTGKLEGLDQGQLDAAGGGGAGAGLQNDLPMVYADPASSKLSVTVEPGKNEKKDFDLKGAAGSGAARGGMAVP